MSKEVGIFIAGRLNNERFNNKLIMPFGKSNLFDIACAKLEAFPKGYNRYVLAHDKELLAIAKNYPGLQIIEESYESKMSQGPLKYIFKELKDLPDTHLMFLNPCLAFLRLATVYGCMKTFERSDADYATSAKLLQNWILDEHGKPVNDINYERLTTKEIKPWFQVAHCFHIFNKAQFFEDGMMLKDGFIPLYVPEDETIDVDTESEYKYAKWRFEEEFGLCL